MLPSLYRFVLISAFSSMIVLNPWYVEAQTQNQVAKFDASGNPVDSAITETSGNVGIGTTTPLANLNISFDSGGTVVNSLRLQEIGGGLSGSYVRFDAGNNEQGSIGGFFDGDQELAFYAGYLHTERMRINGSGLVGIGTMFPLSALHVAGRVLASGYDVASDIRLKHDVTPLTGVLARLDNIRGVSFRWNAQAAALGHATGQRDIGVIAQEVGAVFPELVTTKSPQDLQGVDYGKLTAVLLAAIKEQQAQIRELKADIRALQAKQ
jgi:hypothetical protein